MSVEKVSMKMDIHHPTAEELIQDDDAVSLIKYIIQCYSDNINMSSYKLHGMMDRMYLYNWALAGMIMHRKIITPEQARYDDLQKLSSELYDLSEKLNVDSFSDDIEAEILTMDGPFGLNDIKEFYEYEFFLTDYGLSIFMKVLELIGRKSQRFMTTEELQNFSDSGRLETWIEAGKNREVSYTKSQRQREAEFATWTAKPINRDKSALLNEKDETGIVGWLSPEGEFIKCEFAEHALTAYNMIEYPVENFDEAEEIFENEGYIKFWYLYSLGYGVSAKDHKPNKAQIKWFEKHIEVIDKKQIQSFELLISSI